MQQKDFIYNKFVELSSTDEIRVLVGDSSKKEQLKALKKQVKSALVAELTKTESETVRLSGKTELDSYCSSAISNWLKRDRRYYA